MITVEEALAEVCRRAGTKPAGPVPVCEALGLVLAEDVASDVDSPPHDKALVDGYAVVARDVAGGDARLTILEEVVAGAVPTRTVTSGTATRIMTGAPLPEGADAVVMVERTEVLPLTNGPLGVVRVREASLAPGQNVIRRGAVLQRGEVVLRAGGVIRPVDIGLLSEVGRVQVRAIPRPKVAVLPTGNELVPPGQLPAAGQIRNSNGPMLLASVLRAGGEPIDLGSARDEPDHLRERIAVGLAADVLVLSGGVSAGVLDLVPKLLAESGVEQVFHKVRFKPGKPLWFGVLPAEPIARLVFGLPGNPASSLVSFELFVRPAIGRLAGRAFQGLPRVRARLASGYVHRGDRPTYHPAVLCQEADGALVRPVVWQGSADLRGLAAANALVHFPPGDRTFAQRETLEVLVLDWANSPNLLNL